MSPPAPVRWSRQMMCACVLTFLAGLCILISFASPHWLVKHPRVPNEFLNMGLWEFCFNQYSNQRLADNRVFTGCRWVFHRYYDILFDYLEPSWFMAVQVLMSLGLLSLIATLTFVVIIVLNCCMRRLQRHLLLTFILMFISFIFHSLCMMIFGAKGDSPDWLPKAQWNRYGYAYGFGVLGTAIEFVCSVLFMLEWMRTRRHQAGSRPSDSQQSSLHMKA